ncbi:MAG: hypothetical protein QOG16_941 [Actinomycetota bacterium]|jgi:predicted nucleic acid-binding Zn ribbon protein|nr:hypothetical protein [Actinomycetota bacterium]
MTTDLPPRLRDVLGGVGSRLGLEDTRAIGMLWSQWPEIVGPSIAQNAEPTSLKKGVLRIRATSPGWAQELSYLGGEIKARANAMAGVEVVREVRVWTGPGEVVRATPKVPLSPQDRPPETTDRDAPGDVFTAFERARAAWARRRSRNP